MEPGSKRLRCQNWLFGFCTLTCVQPNKHSRKCSFRSSAPQSTGRVSMTTTLTTGLAAEVPNIYVAYSYSNYSANNRCSPDVHCYFVFCCNILGIWIINIEWIQIPTSVQFVSTTHISPSLQPVICLYGFFWGFFLFLFFVCLGGKVRVSSAGLSPFSAQSMKTDHIRLSDYEQDDDNFCSLQQ